MKTEEEIFWMIDRYLSGELTREEKQAFEKSLSEDPSLRKKLQAHKEAGMLLMDHELVSIKKICRDNDLGETSLRKHRQKNIIKWGVASLLLSIVLISGYKYFEKPVNQKNNNRPEISSNQPHTLYKKSGAKNEQDSITLTPPDKIKTAPANKLSTKKDTSIATPEKEVLPLKESVPNLNSKPVDISKELPIESNVKNVCDGINITFSFRATEVCKNENSGEIIFAEKTVSGGTPPYLFSIDKGKKFQSVSHRTNLSADSYQLLVKDAYGCLSLEKTAEIKEKECEEEREHIFAPAQGGEWEIPVSDNFNGEIQIFNKNGISVYHTAIKNGSPRKWNGNNGTLPLGSYSFFITSTDGSIRKGYVTIIQ